MSYDVSAFYVTETHLKNRLKTDVKPGGGILSGGNGPGYQTNDSFVLHDKSWSIKQQVMLRRLELKATAEVFLVRPSFLMPYMVGRTEAVEKALYLRHWG